MAGIRTAGFYSLFAKFNKKKGSGDEEKQDGLIESFGEFTLEMEDEELNELKRSWEVSYNGSLTKARIHEVGDICERYWIGKQFPDTEYENGKRPLTDNITFEALETGIAQWTQQNPQPIVMADDSDEMKGVGDKIHMSLEFLAQHNDLKNILRDGTRNWAIRFLGVWQISWDGKDEEISVDAVNPKDLILDKNGYIKNAEYHGSFIGRKMYDTAQNLITRFPDKEEAIRQECGDKLGSLLGYTQWRTEEFVFYSLKDIILLKHKNENWNYDQTTQGIDENGQPTTQTIPGQNYFKHPKIPFVFLSVFNLGDEPADKTSLIAQGLVTQDNINKGLKQYDRNVDKINGGLFVNGLMFNKEQAAQAAEANRQGRTIVTPGDPHQAVMWAEQHEIPETVYQRITDDRARFMQRFGVYGSTPTTSSQEETVRGKVIASDQDSSRSSQITQALEVASAKIFEQFYQFIHVYWDAPHWVSVIGPNNAVQMLQFEAANIPVGHEIGITVQNGSMVPQDELSIYNEAMQEWENGVSDPLSYFEKTKDPNPQERAIKLMVFKTNPAQYMQQYLQIAPTAPAAPAAPLPQGGGGGTSGAPPSSVSPPPDQPSAVQSQEHQLISSVPQPKI